MFFLLFLYLISVYPTAIPDRKLLQIAATSEALLGVLGIRDNWANYLRDKG